MPEMDNGNLLGVERFRNPRLVGRGGMGEVYEVWDSRLDRRVAVKRIHPDALREGERTATVLREARAAAKVEHPNVVRVYGVENAGTELLIEMQFIEGHALSELLRGMPLSGELAADLLGQILEGLIACHARGVIHCDLKPANILVTADGTAYLSDFGIAHALRGAAEYAGDFSQWMSRWGTPRYSPPEAWRGETPTPSWDLYSAGVILWEALCGAVPFQGDTPVSLREEIFRGITSQVRAERDGLSEPLAALIDALVRVDPMERPGDANAALRILRKTPEFFAARSTAEFGSSRRMIGPLPQVERQREANSPEVATENSAGSRRRVVLILIVLGLSGLLALLFGLWMKSVFLF